MCVCWEGVNWEEVEALPSRGVIFSGYRGATGKLYKGVLKKNFPLLCQGPRI